MREHAAPKSEGRSPQAKSSPFDESRSAEAPRSSGMAGDLDGAMQRAERLGHRVLREPAPRAVRRTAVPYRDASYPGTAEESSQTFKSHALLDCAFKPSAEMVAAAYQRLYDAFDSLAEKSGWDREMMQWLQHQIQAAQGGDDDADVLADQDDDVEVDVLPAAAQEADDGDDDEEMDDDAEVTAESICLAILAQHAWQKPSNIEQDGATGNGPVCSDLYQTCLADFDAMDTDGFGAYSITAKRGQIDHVALLVGPAGKDPDTDLDEIVEGGYVLDLWAYLCVPAEDYEDAFSAQISEKVPYVRVGNGRVTGATFVARLAGRWTISDR